MFKVAIAGCGLISQLKYIPMFQELKNKAKIVGVCDLNEETLKQVASKFRIAGTYKDFEEMLFREQPDIVVVCTPPVTHKNIVIQALERGAHVLVEKPMALTSADCEQMIEASRRFNKKLGVYA
ncbi:MAG: Gfo/Idh/MocA family oxidoreductase [Candidatus Hydrothermae bacterium]|nr:Gfo/Idh/MocA family oxidoreductase [Candidatus Hydrothermae bacterium]